MKEWQEELLEREGFNKLKTDKMELNWKDGTTTKIVDGEIITVANKNTRTQRDDLKDQAKALEAQLTAATRYGDGIDLMDIYRKLDTVKSLIEAIR